MTSKVHSSHTNRSMPQSSNTKVAPLSPATHTRRATPRADKVRRKEQEFTPRQRQPEITHGSQDIHSRKGAGRLEGVLSTYKGQLPQKTKRS